MTCFFAAVHESAYGQSGLATGAALCPVSGEERTSRFHDVMSGFDPYRKSSEPICCDAEQPPPRMLG
jgi:hypothetical protein